MTRETLTFVHSSTPPTDEVTVFDELTQPFLGTEFRFRVIGSSHYVSAPEYDFYELSSCDPVESTGATIPLKDGGERRRLDHETDGIRCETVLEHRPLASFPAGESFDLSYWFGQDAVTAIALDKDGYETYHTYPEYDLTLYSRTRFTRLPDQDPIGTGRSEIVGESE
ncbi:hypothetical protein ACFQL1_22530 [Halomicroarcula sp. GCM10025709]|uniref:hypothetical protein n=1 Tax=Haloarcula TaxID=2237 RepID=UPI0024C3D3E2|nr:hypothetical protein [Halomicroarcula sp. YJ-61-S]